MCARAAIDETRPAVPNDNFGDGVWRARDAAADAIAAAPNVNLGEAGVLCARDAAADAIAAAPNDSLGEGV